VLYFDQIEHDRFGTIRQQIWALLHFPLHVAILLTAEGSTLLIIWNEIIQNQDWMVNNLWPPGYFATAQDYASSFLTNLTDFENSFKTKYLVDSYNYTAAAANLTHLDISTDEGYNEAYNIYQEMWTAVEVFLFENFQVEAPSTLSPTASEDDKNAALSDVFWTVFIYYTIAAGCLLIVLGVMYWFGKTRKSRWEYGSIVVRIAVGIALTLVSISTLYMTGLYLFWSPWMIPMVVIIYFIGKANFSSI
jgi:hypothetical protein